MKNTQKSIRQGSIAADVVIYGILLVISLIFLYPVYQVLVISVSDPQAVYASRGIMLFPRGIHFEAYEVVLKNRNLISGFKNTLIYLTVGVGLQYVLTVLTAYPLSLKGLPGKKIIWGYFIVTMYFSGGIVPMFLLISKLKMINTVWALTLPNAVVVSNIMIMRTRFITIPDEIRDAAKIDGANDFTLLIKIMLPLSAATGAVLLLFGTVAYWNMWYEPMLYMTKRSMYPMQSVLREILIDNASVAYAGRGRAQVKLTRSADRNAVQLLIRYAVIVVSTAPILIMYPFVQKHFVKGVMLGSLKG